jgi:LPXTG-motif cell wall-anchored protein
VKEELMLTRSLFVAAAAAVALSLMTAVAAAKEVRSATVCGPTDCVSVDDDQRSEALVAGGSPSGPPPKAEAWYRVRLVIGGEGAHASFTVNVLPKSGYIRSRDQFGGSVWTYMDAQQQATYRRLTADLDPFPAERLQGISNPKLPAASPPSPAPAQPADEDEGSSPTPWLIVAGALAALAGAALVRRIRRRSAPAATA